MLAHLDGCRDCRDSLRAATDEFATTRKTRRWWIPAAAAASIAAAVMVVFGVLRPPSPGKRLLALAPKDARTIEPRLSGGFAYAPYRGPLRTDDQAVQSERLRRAGVAGEFLDTAERTKTPAAQRDAGVALLLVSEPVEAARRLRAAAEGENDARTWSDLAAATYAAAVAQNRPSQYAEALAAADRALQLDAAFAEALFNRALILERLGLGQQARDAWLRYLQVDAASAWANEARQRLQRLEAKTTNASLFRSDQPRLEQLAAAGNASAVRALVARYPQQTRTWAEWEYLHRWAAAHRAGNASEAAAALAMCRTIGDALAATSGESLLRESVRAIESGDAAARDAIADAQTLYYQGRIAYNQQRLAAAEPDLFRAAELYARGRSPMAHVARYFAANARFDRNDIRGARAELEELLAVSALHPEFAALGAQVRWELALCHIVAEDFTASGRLLEESQATFRRLGERNYLGFIENLLAITLSFTGRSDDSWAARIRGFELLTEEGHGDKLAVSLSGAAYLEATAGRLDTARAMLRAGESAARGANNDPLLVNTLLRQSLVATYANEDGGAAIAEARAVAERIGDPMLRDAARADVALGEGAALLRNDPAAARARLTPAIEFYRTIEKPLFLPEAFLLRARASLRIGEEDAALRDLEAGIDAVEQGRMRYAGSVTGTGVMDAGATLLQEALALQLKRNDVASAFAIADRAQAQLAPDSEAATLAGLQQKLAGTSAVVLQTAMLPDAIVTIAITETGAAVARRPLPRDLEALIAAVADRGDEAAAKSLFDLLIRPSMHAIAGAAQLIVVPARALEEVPFAALYDAAARRYLVQALPVAIAASAGSLERSDRPAAPRSVVALALEPDSQSALPETADEVDDVRALYARSVELAAPRTTFAAFAAAAADTDVVHIAGHTTLQQGSGETALVFANRHRVSWMDIAGSRVQPSAVVALAACDTLRRPRAPQTRALSLAAGFVAAGARDVVGTLRPIADRDARELFLAVHRELAAGASGAAAVRAAQLETMERNQGWRALALMTGRISAR